jgi:hypothetical protein
MTAGQYIDRSAKKQMKIDVGFIQKNADHSMGESFRVYRKEGGGQFPFGKPPKK